MLEVGNSDKKELQSMIYKMKSLPDKHNDAGSGKAKL